MPRKRKEEWEYVWNELEQEFDKHKPRRQSFLDDNKKRSNMLNFLPKEKVEEARKKIEDNYNQWSSQIRVKSLQRQEEWNDYNKAVEEVTEKNG